MPIRVATLFLLILATASPAVACVCEDDARSLEDRVEERFASHEIVGVFEIAGWKSGRETFASGTESGRWAILKPIHLFKGVDTPRLARAAPRVFKTDCDINLQQSELVLVYAQSREAVPVRFCSASGPLRSRMHELRVLFRMDVNAASEARNSGS